jgi:hypothetical protein
MKTIYISDSMYFVEIIKYDEGVLFSGFVITTGILSKINFLNLLSAFTNMWI